MIQIQIRDQLTAAIRDAALQVSENLGVQRLIDSVTSYPAKIREQQSRVQEAKRAMEQAKYDLKQAEALITVQVTVEVGENGKPKYSNETARQVGAQIKMNTDPGYQKLREALQDAEDKYNAALFDASCLDNEFRAHTKAADLVAAQINFLAGSGQ